MKKILIYGLIILNLFNSVNAMEETETIAMQMELYTNLGVFEIFPEEIRSKIISDVLEDNINKWDDVFNFDYESLEALIKKFRLVSKNFVFEEDLNKFIEKLKNKRFEYLKEIIKEQYQDSSNEELNQKLIDFLNSGGYSITEEILKEAIRLIISGANIDNKSDRKYGSKTALMYAAEEGHLAIVKLLIKSGANKNIKTNRGRSPFMLATVEGHVEIVRFLIKDYSCLIKHQAVQKALKKAARYGHTEVVRLIIEKGFKIEGKYLDSALNAAVDRGHTGTVRFLIANGADIDNSQTGGWTCLMFAVRAGRIEIVKLLIAGNADINIKNHEGYTALMFALREDIAQLLIKQHADVNIRNNNGMTALRLAWGKDRPKIMKLLIENGADIDIKSREGKAMLMWAEKNNHNEIVKLLKG